MFSFWVYLPVTYVFLLVITKSKFTFWSMLHFHSKYYSVFECDIFCDIRASRYLRSDRIFQR